MHIQLIRADTTSLKVDAMVNPSKSSRDEITSGNLFCKFVIHAAVPSYDGADADQELERATLRALTRAEELAIASVAVPPLWTSSATNERCARMMVRAAISFRSRARSVQRVVFTLFSEEAYVAFERALKEQETPA